MLFRCNSNFKPQSHVVTTGHQPLLHIPPNFNIYKNSPFFPWSQFMKINPTRCTILLSIFISLLYMFWATTCPSSWEITVTVRHWYLSFCMGGVWSACWSFTPTSRPDTTQTEWQIPVSHRYSNFSWWWARGCPKHVEKRNKYTKQNWASSWIYLQDCTRMHSQQNIKFNLRVPYDCQNKQQLHPELVGLCITDTVRSLWCRNWIFK